MTPISGASTTSTNTISMNTKAPMKLIPYIFPQGSAEEAINFYVATLGAEVGMLMRYEDCPEPIPEGRVPPGYEKKVMHAELIIGSSRLLISVGCGKGEKPAAFSLHLGVENIAEAERLFDALGEGGSVCMPLEKTFWSARFGVVTDRFGISWMVGVD